MYFSCARHCQALWIGSKWNRAPVLMDLTFRGWVKCRRIDHGQTVILSGDRLIKWGGEWRGMAGEVALYTGEAGRWIWIGTQRNQVVGTCVGRAIQEVVARRVKMLTRRPVWLEPWWKRRSEGAGTWCWTVLLQNGGSGKERGMRMQSSSSGMLSKLS